MKTPKAIFRAAMAELAFPGGDRDAAIEQLESIEHIIDRALSAKKFLEYGGKQSAEDPNRVR